jgi:subtilisin family serine protease
LVACATVDDDLLQPNANSGEVARRLVEGIVVAVQYRPRVIQLSLEFGFGDARAAKLLRDAVAQCLRRGIAVVLAAGRGQLRRSNPLVGMPGVIPVTAADEAGGTLYDHRWGTAMALTGLAAPGTEIPGAGREGRLAHRAGSSYAASFVSAAIALVTIVMPWMTGAEAAAALFLPRTDEAASGRLKALNADHSLEHLESEREAYRVYSAHA